jgi:putative photosynthetic complex assembly protein 2
VLEIGCAVLFAVFLWWASTGAILFLDGLPRRTFAVSMAVMSVVAAIAAGALWLTRGEATGSAVVIAFSASLALWAWNEMAFLMGYITGPRRRPATPGARGLARFLESSATLITHEIVIAATAGLIWLLVRDGENHFGFWTFLVLWIMRLSTKINIFLGAPNVTEDFLPPHLGYLSTYFRKRPMNGFFPVSITVATLVTAWLAHLAVAPGTLASVPASAGPAPLGLEPPQPCGDGACGRWRRSQDINHTDRRTRRLNNKQGERSTWQPESIPWGMPEGVAHPPRGARQNRSCASRPFRC